MFKRGSVKIDFLLGLCLSSLTGDFSKQLVVTLGLVWIGVGSVNHECESSLTMLNDILNLIK